tara:strand:+ start:629 stop:877 length:249 start_codon:yes stop_codon:yes gene_type:complete
MDKTIVNAHQYLDLKGTPCPLNFVKCKLALEQIDSQLFLEVDLDKGEPEDMVSSGLSNEGYSVEKIKDCSGWVRLRVKLSEQ